MSDVGMETEEVGFQQSVDSAERAFKSLADALRGRKIPLENHALISRIVTAVGAGGFFNRSGYVKATGPVVDLHIHFGYTNGIPSEAVAQAVLDNLNVPGAVVYRSKRSWGIAHPVNAIRDGGGPNASRNRIRRDYGTCPACTMKIFANGTCGCA